MTERRNDRLLNYGPAMQATSQTTYGVGSAYTWDAFMRQSYEQANRLIDAQAQLINRRGNITYAEAQWFVEGQRNALVIQIRDRLSPWGRRYSELVKPTAKLPSIEDMMARKGSVEAVMLTVGKSRTSVNRFSAVMRVAGPAAIAVQMTLSAVIIADAAPEDRSRVAAGQAGSIVGGALGGAGGALAGCTSLSMLVSPTLLIPIVGEVTTGGACLVGGIAGAAGAGWLGAMLGERAATKGYDLVTKFRWTRS